MQAIIYTEFGGPEVLALGETDKPVPGPGEVRVRVVTVGVNPLDHKRRNGWVEEFYPDAGFGGRAFELKKHVRTADSGLYHVHVPAAGESSCDCRGFQRWGQCKHVAALEKLITLGRLPHPADRAANTGEDAGSTEYDEQPEPATV